MPPPLDVKILDLAARPRRLAQEGETGFEAGIEKKAADRHLATELGPAEFLDKLGEELLEGDAVKRIAGGMHLGSLR